ncbi:MAG: Recombination protein RecR [Calditrichaeota bacterium]|nr:Recombination protein RecR [Calditrichota bacterium]
MASTLPPAVLALQDELSKMPGLGKKSALRMAMYLLRSDRETVERLSRAVIDVKDKVEVCTVCGFLSDRDPCHICHDPKRSSKIVCVVEQPTDVIALEKGNVFPGRYHVLGGVLAPLEHVGPEDINIRGLVNRIESEGIEEVIVATNPTPEGEQTAYYIAKLLAPRGVNVSRIARGIPVGADLENADDLTLTRALEGRSRLD